MTLPSPSWRANWAGTKCAMVFVWLQLVCSIAVVGAVLLCQLMLQTGGTAQIFTHAYQSLARYIRVWVGCWLIVTTLGIILAQLNPLMLFGVIPMSFISFYHVRLMHPLLNFIKVVAGLGIFLLHSIFSRSAGLADWFIPTIADFVHLLLSGLWLGGVAMLSAVVVPVVQKNEALLPEFALFLKKFSALAMFCVMGLGLTGLAQASLFLSSFDDVFATSYGQALLLKVSLFAILIGFGAWHQQRILPRMVRKPKNDGRLMQHLQKTLWAETAISAVLLIVVTLMKVL